MKRAINIALISLLLAGCVTSRQLQEQSTIGPFTQFSGRLIIIDSAHRWQVLIDWNGTPESGSARLTHGASNRIVNIQWRQDRIRLQDNLDPARQWRNVSADELQKQGIILPPAAIARILSGDMPASLSSKHQNEWEGAIGDTSVRIRWFPDSKRLELTDVSHGRKAILIITS